jgi:hypothetical protein
MPAFEAVAECMSMFAEGNRRSRRVATLTVLRCSRPSARQAFPKPSAVKRKRSLVLALLGQAHGPAVPGSTLELASFPGSCDRGANIPIAGRAPRPRRSASDASKRNPPAWRPGCKGTAGPFGVQCGLRLSGPARRPDRTHRRRQSASPAPAPIHRTAHPP